MGVFLEVLSYLPGIVPNSAWQGPTQLTGVVTTPVMWWTSLVCYVSDVAHNWGFTLCIRDLGQPTYRA